MKKIFPFSYSATEIGINPVFDETKEPSCIKIPQHQYSRANKTNCKATFYLPVDSFIKPMHLLGLVTCSSAML